MRTLQTAPGAAAPANTTAQEPAIPITTQVASENTHVTKTQPSEPIVDASTAPTQLAPHANLTRAETEAIGPSTDTPATNPDNTNGPTLVIMLLLTTGARHPYKIDERYLKKRNVAVEAMDPYNISVYTLKELIWRDWREGTLECMFSSWILRQACINTVMIRPCVFAGTATTQKWSHVQ